MDASLLVKSFGIRNSKKRSIKHNLMFELLTYLKIMLNINLIHYSFILIYGLKDGTNQL